MRIFVAVVIMVLAIAIAVLPHFYTCQYSGRDITTATGMHVPMKCNWSAQAEIAVGLPLLAVGTMMLFSRRKESTAFLSIMGVILGIAVILIPEKLIGVCSSQMPCNTVMEPSILAMGSVVVAVSLAGTVVSLASKQKQL